MKMQISRRIKKLRCPDPLLSSLSSLSSLSCLSSLSSLFSLFSLSSCLLRQLLKAFLLSFFLYQIFKLEFAHLWRKKKTTRASYESLIFSLGIVFGLTIYFVGFAALTSCRWPPRKPNFIKLGRFFAFALIFSGLGYLTGFLFMSINSTWCCVRAFRRAQLCHAALTMKEVFEEREMKYFVTWGTLLGALRTQKGTDGVDSERGLILWDHSIKFALDDDSVPFAIDLLQDKGLKIEKLSNQSTAFRILVPVEPRLWHGYSSWAADWTTNVSKTRIDVYPFLAVGDKDRGGVDERFLFNPTLGQDRMWKDALFRDVFPTVNVSVCGTPFPAPRRPAALLSPFYGDDYLTRLDFGAENPNCGKFLDC